MPPLGIELVNSYKSDTDVYPHEVDLDDANG